MHVDLRRIVAQRVVGRWLWVFLVAFPLAVRGGDDASIPSVFLLPPVYEPKPLPADQPRRGYLFTDAMLARNRRTLAEAYLKVGQRDPKWDDSMCAFLEGLALAMSEQTTAPSTSNMLVQADAIRSAGCSDPLLLYGRGYCLGELERHEEATSSMRMAHAAFEANPVYPYSRMVWASLRMARIYFVGGGGRRNAEMDRLCELNVRWLAESLLRGETRPGEERIFLDQVFGNLSEWEKWGYSPEQLWLEFHRQTGGAGEAGQWVRNIVLADYHVKAGWNARGTGYADEVTEEGWKLLRTHLQAAADLLKEAYRLHPEYPEAARRMISVSLGLDAPPHEPPRLWFDRAVAADFEGKKSYDSFLNTLLPRWNGSHREMLEFGRECLATGRFDTSVPSYYWMTILAIGQELDRPGDLFRNARIYAESKEVLDHQIRSGVFNTTQWKTYRLCASYWAGDFPEAKKILLEIGPRYRRYMGRENPFAVSYEQLMKDLGVDETAFSAPAPASPPRIATTFEYPNPDASNVFLIGTFNSWNPSSHPMVRDGQGVWRITLELPPNWYGYQFLVDGVARKDPFVDATLGEEGGPTGSLRIVAAGEARTNISVAITMAPIVVPPIGSEPPTVKEENR